MKKVRYVVIYNLIDQQQPNRDVLARYKLSGVQLVIIVVVELVKPVLTPPVTILATLLVQVNQPAIYLVNILIVILVMFRYAFANH